MGRDFGIGPGAPIAVERIEGGLLSQRADMDETVNPYEISLGRYVDVDQAAGFVGKAALSRIKRQGPARRLVGLFIDGPPLPATIVPWPIRDADGSSGAVTSAVHSIRLQRNIAYGLIPAAVAAGGHGLTVATPEGPRAAEQTGLPFIG